MAKYKVNADRVGVVGDGTKVDQLAQDNDRAVLIVLILSALVLFVGTVAIAFFNQVIATFAFGIIFVVAMLVLAFTFSQPTPIQYLVMRIVLALASAGIAAMLTGFISVEIPAIGSNARPLVQAGGALAVFVIIYFRSPAALVATPKDQA
jgi:hypothetical protein